MKTMRRKTRAHYDRAMALLPRALAAGPLTLDQAETLRRRADINRHAWQRARETLRDSGVVQSRQMLGLVAPPDQQPPPVDAEAIRRTRKTQIAQTAGIGSVDLLAVGRTRRSRRDLVDALDATFIILREWAKDRQATTDDLFAAVQRETGIERQDFDAIAAKVMQTGIVGGRP